MGAWEKSMAGARQMRTGESYTCRAADPEETQATREREEQTPKRVRWKAEFYLVSRGGWCWGQPLKGGQSGAVEGAPPRLFGAGFQETRGLCN